MVLADAVKVDDFPVEVVQNLDLGRPFLEEHLGTSRECLYIRRVFGKTFNDLLSEAVFASYVRERS